MLTFLLILFAALTLFAVVVLFAPLIYGHRYRKWKRRRERGRHHAAKAVPPA